VGQVYFELAALTVACVSVDVDNLFDGGVTLFVCTSSATSSSISVVSVPFDVTGEGPTISKGLFMPAPLTEEAPSIELGRRLEEPAELCADLQARTISGWMKYQSSYITYKEENREELVRPGEFEFDDWEKSA
jgi:hypothetical protein